MIEAATTDRATTDKTTSTNEFSTGEFEKTEGLGELLDAALSAIALPEEALVLSPADVAFQALQQRLARLPHAEPSAVALKCSNSANSSNSESACMPGQAEPPAAYQAPSPSWWVGMARLE